MVAVSKIGVDRLCWALLSWMWGKSQRQVLLRCSSMVANVTSYPTCCGSQFHLSAGQRTCASGAWHNRTPAAWNTWFHFSRAMAQQSGAEPRQLQDLGSHAAACVRDADPQCRRTQAATGWRLERSTAKCCRRCCQRVEKASADVFSRREDTLNICCRLFWQRNETINRQSMHNVFSTFLIK